MAPRRKFGRLKEAQVQVIADGDGPDSLAAKRHMNFVYGAEYDVEPEYTVPDDD